MKRAALIFLLIFAFVQAGPAVSFILTGGTTVFVVDEEKNNENPEKEKKEKKDIICLNKMQASFLQKLFQSVNKTDKPFSHPCIERQTPPPNSMYIFA